MMDKQILNGYILEEQAMNDGSVVTWVRRSDGSLIRGYWDSCPPTRRGHALDLVQGLADGTLQETYHDVYGPAKEWSQYDELPKDRSLFKGCVN